jgi:7-carboxy-7-deazaguanine synthase
MKYPVVEIFYSIQGEGLWVGSATHFIRFAGCNVNCEFCDTDYAKREDLSVKEIVKRVGDASSVCLTGGEPTMHNLLPLIEEFHKRGVYVQIETNGTGPDEIYRAADWVTCSPKTWVGEWWRFNELKWLVGDGQELWQKVVDKWLPPGLPAFQFLQPVWGPNYKKNLKRAIELVKQHPRLFRLGVQLHKYIGVK